MPTREILVVFTIAAAIIFLVFAYVGLGSRRGRDVDYAAANRLRRRFFLGFSGLLVVGLVLTLPRMPYPADVGPADRIVHVTGKQYAFALTDAPVTSLQDWDEGVYPQVAEVPAGSTVEFRVATLDVNHGFSVYSPEGELMAQTQAMPGYVNRLRLRFDRPGTYAVLCLEYCGMGHHRMRGAIEVR
jgi:cytochrome c oxidase subunit II